MQESIGVHFLVLSYLVRHVLVFRLNRVDLFPQPDSLGQVTRLEIHFSQSVFQLHKHSPGNIFVTEPDIEIFQSRIVFLGIRVQGSGVQCGDGADIRIRAQAGEDFQSQIVVFQREV